MDVGEEACVFFIFYKACLSIVELKRSFEALAVFLGA